jgi:uncharacterized protein
MGLGHHADAGLLVPLFTVDAFTARARAWLADAPRSLLVSDFAGAALASAVARKRRAWELSGADATQALETFDRWTAQHAIACEAQPADMAAATERVTAPDAINLATASRRGASIVAFDAGMAAARAPAFPVTAA